MTDGGGVDGAGGDAGGGTHPGRAGARTGVVLMAYGSPRRPDEVEAYYTHIRRGRPPTPELLADLRRRYEAIGGVSPLVERTEAQRDALTAALEAASPGRFTVALGHKHAPPFIEDAVASLAARRVERIVGLVLAPQYSALSVGEYLARAAQAATAAGVAFDGIEDWHRLDAFIAFTAAAVRDGLARLPAGDATTVVFTAHSLPARVVAMGDPYVAQVRGTAEAVAAAAGLGPGAHWGTAWQSAGRTPEPWLAPDVTTVVRDLAGTGRARGLLVCAAGFVADHLEVLHDLDVEAAGLARSLGLAFGRTRCVNDDRAVFGALARLVAQRAGA